MNFRVLPEADGEILEAALWYEGRQPGLGDDFLAELKEAFESIRRGPRNLPILEGYSGTHEVRRCMLRRFPYAVIVLCRPSETLVVAVAHVRRRPLYWIDRLE